MKHNLASVAEQMTVPENEPPEVTQKVMRLMVTLNFSLIGIQPKVDIVKSTPLCEGKWMVFLNNAGNLAHIMHYDEADEGTYIRMKVSTNLKNAHENFVRRYFYNRLVARYII